MFGFKYSERFYYIRQQYMIRNYFLVSNQSDYTLVYYI